MNNEIENTIEVIARRVAVKDAEINELKKLVNQLCKEAGIEPRYENIAEAGAGSGSVRSDEYYGQPLTSAIRKVLERRKSVGLGAASVADIYKAVRDG